MEAISKEFYSDPKLLEENKNLNFFKRAILCLKNVDVDTINKRMLDKHTGK